MSMLRTEPATAKRNQQVSIYYNGPLATAEELFLHYGFDGWVSPKSLKMAKNSDQSFEVVVTAKGQRALDFCFHSGDNQWDNNMGLNWQIRIS